MDMRQKASLFAIAAATVLAASKFFAGGVSGSMAVTSSGLDSLLDAFMSGINFLAIKKAAEPADDLHQYGHYKIEDLAAVGQSLVIIFSGSTIIYKAARKFLGNEAIVYTGLDLGVMVLSVVFSVLISRVLTNVARRTDSKALRADALHYTSDLYSNFGAIAAICLSYYTGRIFFDVLFAVIVGFIILLSAGRILWQGYSGLMDTRIPIDMEKEIERVIAVMPYPCAGYHKLRTRTSGSKWYADFHLLACRKANIDEAHDLSQKVEQELNKMHRSFDVTIHIEPCPHECELTDETCSVRRNPPVAPGEGNGTRPKKTNLAGYVD